MSTQYRTGSSRPSACVGSLTKRAKLRVVVSAKVSLARHWLPPVQVLVDEVLPLAAKNCDWPTIPLAVVAHFRSSRLENWPATLAWSASWISFGKANSETWLPGQEASSASSRRYALGGSSLTLTRGVPLCQRHGCLGAQLGRRSACWRNGRQKVGSARLRAVDGSRKRWRAPSAFEVFGVDGSMAEAVWRAWSRRVR